VDRRICELHGVKIAAAKEVCMSLYNGFPHTTGID